MKSFIKENQKILIFIIVGIIFTTVSFVLEYGYPSLKKNILTFIIFIDSILLICNTCIISCSVSNTKKKKYLNSILFPLFYLLFFLTIGTYLVDDKINITLFIGIIKIALYIGPVIIIMLPIFLLICIVIVYIPV